MATEIMDVDVESVFKRAFSATVLNDPSTSNIKCRRLDPELSSVFREMIRTLGFALGAKHGAILVDAVVSDFFEASFHLPKRSDAFLEWVHEWLGSLLVARELLLGIFSSPAASEHGNKQYRTYKALALSTLPLLVDSSLWNLPLDDRNVGPETKKMLTPKVLRCNEYVVVALLELSTAYCYLLRQEDMENLMSLILPAVVEKAGQKSAESVETASLQTLKTIASSAGLKSTEELIFRHQIVLIAAMLGRVRVPGGSQVPNPGDVDDITSTTNSLRWVLEMVVGRAVEINGPNASPTAKSSVVDLLSVMEYRYDHLFVQNVLQAGDVEDLCSLHKACFDFFLDYFGVDRDATYTYKIESASDDQKQPWLDQLSNFRKRSSGQGLHEDSNSEVYKENGSDKTPMDVSKADISLFSNLIARNCYLLSHKQLQIRIKSCDGLLLGFRFLAFVGTVYEVHLMFLV
jgi:hypothetical protein